jgi:arylsulfatase A-like enzyme
LKNIFLMTVLFAFLMSCNTTKQKGAESPNFIFILADDLGYGEIGIQGQKWIETPNIDQLAREGMIMTDHYSGAPVCAPARAVLMTGLHAGNNPVRGNSEWGERGDVWSFKAMFEDSVLEGQRPMPDSILTVANMLQSNGYKTGMVGKWGLGAPNTSSIPNKKGFDFFYGYNCQRQAHTLYPSHLWRNQDRHILNNEIVDKGSLPEGWDPDDDKSYALYIQNDYAPTLMHHEAMQFLERNQGQKFFLYYASPLPHLPLQAPQKWVDHYKTKLGPEKPYLGNAGYYPNRTPRATYAAMISYLDEQVGDIVAFLKKTGQYENTMIVFSSDNGPTHIDKQVDIQFFNSTGIFVNSKNTVKGNVNEGGIRVPTIVTWPAKIKAGSTSDHPSVLYDYFATVCDILGVESPYPTDGISYYPALTEKPQQKHDYLYWEFPGYGGQQAIRMGNWKGFKKNLFKGPSAIELYDLTQDPKELNDLAAEHPEMVKKMEDFLDEAHTTAAQKKFRIPVLEKGVNE